MKPIIGITVDLFPNADADERLGPEYKLRRNYVQYVVEAGGVPVIIPPISDIETLAQMVDGWLIPGGRDIDPQHFGQERHPKANLMDSSRFDAEKRMFDALPATVPILGVCLGAQMLNVLHGGSLHQHLPDLPGRVNHEKGAEQSYRVEPETLLHQIVKRDSVMGLSYHHQAIDRLGGGLRVSATHEDGTVEAIEGTGPRWLVAVQWHPERFIEEGIAPELFENFIAAARNYRASRSA